MIYNRSCSSRWRHGAARISLCRRGERVEHCELGDAVRAMQGNATTLPFADGRFSAVLCFKMLGHIPLREQQDPSAYGTLGWPGKVNRPGFPCGG